MISLKKSLLFTVLGLTGCRTIVGTAVMATVAAVTVVGATGYGIYKGGESVATSVGSALSSKESKKSSTVTIYKNTFSAKPGYSVPQLHKATINVYEKSGFKAVSSKGDALKGRILAKTETGVDVSVKFELLSKDKTSIQIKIGGGNLAQSEYLYDQILLAAKKGDI